MDSRMFEILPEEFSLRLLDLNVSCFKLTSIRKKRFRNFELKLRKIEIFEIFGVSCSHATHGHLSL